MRPEEGGPSLGTGQITPRGQSGLYPTPICLSKEQAELGVTSGPLGLGALWRTKEAPYCSCLPGEGPQLTGTAWVLTALVVVVVGSVSKLQFPCL